jgi:ketosteroid isomerase-like protein
MRRVFRMLAIAASLAMTFVAHAGAAPSDSAGVARFNERFAAATRAMSDSSVLALWDDDGISLLPMQAPLVGKPALRAMLAGVRARYPDAHMRSFDCRCHDLEIAGDWASEWCDEHQVVDLPDHKVFDGRGRMLLVLHRDAGGAWRLAREMWIQAEAP